MTDIKKKIAEYRDYVYVNKIKELPKHDAVKEFLYYYYVGYDKGQRFGYKKEFAEGLAEVGSENAKAMLEGCLDGNGSKNPEYKKNGRVVYKIPSRNRPGQPG